MPGDLIRVEPCFGGLNRAFGFQSQPPFTTPDCINVRPRDTFDRRRRIASRPGLTKAYPTEIGIYQGTAGTASAVNPSVIDDAAVSDWRYYVEVGDTMTVVSGTNVVAGDYVVSAVDSAGNNFSLSSDITSGGAGSAIVYTIRRASQDINLMNSVRPITTALTKTFTEKFQLSGVLGSITDWDNLAWTGYAHDVEVGQQRVYPNQVLYSAYIRPFYSSTPNSTQQALVAVGSDLNAQIVNLDTTGDNRSAGACHTAITGMSLTSPYLLQLQIRWGNKAFSPIIAPPSAIDWRYPQPAGVFYIFGFMDNTSPDPVTAGFIARLALYDAGDMGQATLTLTKVVATVQTTQTVLVTMSPFPQQWMYMNVSVNPTTGTVGLRVNNQTSSSQILETTFSPVVGNRWGMGLANNVTSIDTGDFTKYPVVEKMSVFYTASSSGDTRARKLVVGSSGNVWVETATGGLTQIATHTPNANMRIRDDVLLSSAERGAKLYIADYGPRVTGSNGSTASATPQTFDSATYTDWTTSGVAVGDILTITSGTNVTAGQYVVSGVASGNLTLVTNPGNSGADIVFSIQRGPKILDLETSTLSVMTATTAYANGALPVGCSIVTLYNDCLVFAGDFYAPNVWYFSAQGTPTDFDYTRDASIVTRAVIGSSTEAGIIGDDITAVCAASDDYLIFFCEHSLWILRGHPAAGGRIDNLSKSVGCVFRSAWCHGPQGEVYFLSRDGLYVLPPGIGGGPQPLSRETIPSELIEIKVQSTRITMEYDMIRQGIDIWLTPEVDGLSGRHFFYDVKMGFWPQEFPADYQSRASHVHYLPGEEDRIAIMGGRDGFIRRLDDNSASDDGTAISSECYIGPIRLGAHDTAEGKLAEMTAILAESSDNITWELWVGETPESAYLAATSADQAGTLSRFTGTWNNGMNHREHPRARGACAFIKLTANTADERWALEAIQIRRQIAGRVRLA